MSVSGVLAGEQSWHIECCDVLDGLASMPDGCVQTIVTSPPYWGLRDYGVDGAIGLESIPDEYVAKIIAVARELRRVLRDDGTFWLNLGDSYATSPPGNTKTGVEKWATSSLHGAVSETYAARLDASVGAKRSTLAPGLKAKDLVGIPWRVALALQADGWWLRQEVTWCKPNGMPESVTDRPTSATEKLFLLTKAARYFYDAEAVKTDRKASYAGPSWEERKAMGANLRNWWVIPTQPFPDAHFATFPQALAVPCIKAGTSEHGCCRGCGAPWRRRVERVGGVANPSAGVAQVVATGGAISGGTEQSTLGNGQASSRTLGWEPTCGCDDGESNHRPCLVLDPFAGAGTTGIVARKIGCRFIGLELNPGYCEMARARIERECPPTLWEVPSVDDAIAFYGRNPATTDD